MIRNFKLVKVDHVYCDYLRKYDNKVSYNAGVKELRPFIGILFEVDGFKYFAPLSSPKIKHMKIKNNMDIIKIDGGKLGVVNFNNMIPVNEGNYEIIDLNEEPKDTPSLKRQLLLKTQLLWLNKNIKNVKGKATTLYFKYKNDELPERIKMRCCNFKLLEEKCNEYNK